MKCIVSLLVRWVQSWAHANQNLAKIILRQEQRNHILFAVALPPPSEKDLDLSPRKRYLKEIRRLIKLSKQQIEDREATDSDAEDVVSLIGYHPDAAGEDETLSKLSNNDSPGQLLPHKWTIELQVSYIVALETFLSSTLNTANLSPIEGSVTCWYRCVLESGDVARSHQMAKSNVCRSASSVRCEVEDVDGNTYTLYGTVKFFFTYTYEDIEYKLAFLEEYKVEKDDLLLYISSGHRTFRVISVIAIKELVGILISKGRQYLVSRNNPYLGR